MADRGNRLTSRERLSDFLDALIPALLARRTIQVVISGEDLSTLTTTLTCLTALHRSGYLLRLAFSHSACHSSLQAACLDGLAVRQIHALCDNAGPESDTYCQLYLPALSTNSLSKIALGIGDNLVSRWAFHALSQQKPIVVTLTHPVLPAALQARLAEYAATLTTYGITVIGQEKTAKLITLSDARQLPAGEPVHIGRHTLVTPAARDEFRTRGIELIASRGEICIWQK
ncbi:hypothetical protein EDF81_0302 [Enterobacter sp. BIGb0383]|uniref:flavoprotein n=1 Tax=unclassified Enterobacter TaxID=2608935 RepID=UPI000F46540C|nr:MULTISPECIES: flavoprotein [unclassified Enterobacter]ROP61828.1 hypothetical protein EDF81_0302 [Enterobacter sp. BIGb0383]ROS11989.1 hypothetical protein EC848_0302 [Enterobacter sp. BIGb0359]